MRRLILVAVLLFVGVAAYAQTPDGETPANEGVCDELIGFTPGLYGLCVAFCEAQDCVATLDEATGELTFDENCKPSNPKILEKYTERKGPDDPYMPCVNIEAGECPCWTEDEIAQLAVANTFMCYRWDEDENNWQMQGVSLENPDGIEYAVTYSDLVNAMLGRCMRQDWLDANELVFVNLLVTPEEITTCQDSLAAECAARGF